jgi:hypothetical protein
MGSASPACSPKIALNIVNSSGSFAPQNAEFVRSIVLPRKDDDKEKRYQHDETAQAEPEKFFPLDFA